MLAERGNNEMVKADGGAVQRQVNFVLPNIEKVTSAASFSIYFSLFAKIVFTSIAIYVIVVSINVVSKDIKNQEVMTIEDETREIMNCRKSFEENGCAKGDLVPLLKKECRRLEQCMESKPRGASISKLAAKFAAQVINEFVNPLSGKAILIIALIAAAILIVPTLKE